MVGSGRGDLAQSLGLVGQPSHPKVMEAEEYIVKKALEHGKLPNVLVNTPERVVELKKLGVLCFTIARDTALIYAAMKKHVASFK